MTIASGKIHQEGKIHQTTTTALYLSGILLRVFWPTVSAMIALKREEVIAVRSEVHTVSVPFDLRRIMRGAEPSYPITAVLPIRSRVRHLKRSSRQSPIRCQSTRVASSISQLS